MSEYSRTYEIRWSDLDANNHVNYATYIDAAGDLRYRFFTERGPQARAGLSNKHAAFMPVRRRFMRRHRPLWGLLLAPS